MSKQCMKCKIEKSLDDFYKHKAMKDGHLNKCIECAKKDVAENSKITNYDQTEKGVIRVIYKTQKRHNRLRGHGEMPYTKKQLSEWLYKNGFYSIWAIWTLRDNHKMAKPSVDRINDFKGYSLDNIKLGTWEDNHRHQMNDLTNGTGTIGKACKAVDCFKDNVLIKTYVSISSAKRDVGYSIWHLLKKGSKDTKNGYIWKYNLTI